jgi:hypothetical protein
MAIQPITNSRDLIFTLVTVAVIGTMLFVVYPRVFGRDVYTLYRNSGTDMTETGHSAARIHIATFDANEAGAYNPENCEIASKLFKQQYGVTRVNYWCEKGRYK